MYICISNFLTPLMTDVRHMHHTMWCSKHQMNSIKQKVKQSLYRAKAPGFQEDESPRFLDNQHKKVARLSALCTGCLYSIGNIPGTHFCYRLNWPQGHNAAGRIKSMKNSNNPPGIKSATFQNEGYSWWPIMVFIIQLPFIFLSAAHHTGHLLPAPKCQYKN